jgi:hypothetical protein
MRAAQVIGESSETALRSLRVAAGAVEYEVRVFGRLGPAAIAAFADLSVQVKTTMTVLSGTWDRASLAGVLERIRSLGLELVDVRRV